MHPENKAAQGYLSVPLYNSLSIAGGPTSLVPLSDGGFLGVFTATPAPGNVNVDFQNEGPVTLVGLARFNANGALVGKVKVLASSAGTFLSFPQLAPLGNGAYLFGYAKMASLSEKQSLQFAYPDALRAPASYHIFEIDENGNPLTAEKTVSGAGWGEQDQMVPLGEGQVAWNYTPNAVRSGATLPSCSSNQIALNVYSRKR